MIGEFERRIAAMPTDQVRVTLDAMALGRDDAKSQESITFFCERVISCRLELVSRGIVLDRDMPSPGPPDSLRTT